MGHGIAQLFAQAGFQVTLNDVSLKILERAIPRIQDCLQRLVNHGIISPEDADEIPDRITITTDLDKAVLKSDYIIEAVVEDLVLVNGINEIEAKTIYGELQNLTYLKI